MRGRKGILTKSLQLLFEELYQSCTKAVSYYNHRHGNTFLEIQQKIMAKDTFQLCRVEHQHPNMPDREIAVVNVIVDSENLALFVDFSGKSNLPMFTLDLDASNAIVLKHEGREFSLAEAAERILDPLMFPDLLQRFCSTSKA